MLPFGNIVMVSGDMLMRHNPVDCAAAETRIGVSSVMPKALNLTVVCPAATACTCPSAVTVATEGLLDNHWAPRARSARTDNLLVCPTESDTVSRRVAFEADSAVPEATALTGSVFSTLTGSAQAREKRTVSKGNDDVCAERIVLLLSLATSAGTVCSQTT
jgi:hypothetical protein